MGVPRIPGVVAMFLCSASARSVSCAVMSVARRLTPITSETWTWFFLDSGGSMADLLFWNDRTVCFHHSPIATEVNANRATIIHRKSQAGIGAFH